MTWEETIKFIRNKEEHRQLVKDTYIDEDLCQNVQRYGNSEEFKEIVKIIKSHYKSENICIADIGSGNGITAINLALLGYSVIAIEPNKSETVGSKAIENLKKIYSLNNLKVFEGFGESTSIKTASVEIYFARQTMHHANHLINFTQEASRMLKKNGLFFTVRDHVIFNKADKQRFLENHPLHKYYGGENAYTLEEYLLAIEKAGLKILKIFKHFDNPVNYAPVLSSDLANLPQIKEREHQLYLSRKYPLLSKIPGAFSVYKLKAGFAKKKVLNEKYIPGRMYSFIAQKV